MTDERVTEHYRAYGPVIYARCRRLLADGEAAEDATQETFMRVHRHLDKADGALESDRHMAARDQRLQVTPRAATEIEDGERRFGFDMTQ